ncbi:MAG: tRNA threonylcarbamoyladenosine biosynthesis protein TsaE [Limisphaerales bacterium]|jgi:tRNA threonylcarbamoyladenosine biosynthesis protein TsaE
MSEFLLRSTSLADLDTRASALLEACKYGRKFAFYGAMGIGKTTFIKVICAKLGCNVPTSSPTFSIINEYARHKDDLAAVYHMDLYRLKSVEELIDIGIEDYLDQDSYCFIEWPALAEPFLDFTNPSTVHVNMEPGEDGVRIIRVKTSE